MLLPLMLENINNVKKLRIIFLSLNASMKTTYWGKKVFIGKGLGFQLSQNINFQFWHKHIYLAMFSFGSKVALDYITVNKKSVNLFFFKSRTELFSIAMYSRSTLYTV